MTDWDTCNTQSESYPQPITILAQCLDWFRFGPLTSELLWSSVERRWDYVEVTKQNYYGKWYVDFSGDKLELIRTVESIQNLLDFAMDVHWSRLDIAFDVTGIEIAKLPRPGTVICNDNKIETVYSHHLKLRGRFPVFAGRTMRALPGTMYRQARLDLKLS